MKYKNLSELSAYLEKFELEQGIKNFSINGFAKWLEKETGIEKASDRFVTNSNPNNFMEQSIDVQISILIGRMAKYARVYSKKVLQNTELSGLDDYSFMATLMFNESMTKSELTHHNLMESSTSGSDIIKRLLQKGYIEEKEDPIDKRSKQVMISSAGKNLMIKVFKEMKVVSKIISGNLNLPEKKQLFELLNKLEVLHKIIYDNARKLDLNDIKSKYIFEER